MHDFRVKGSPLALIWLEIAQKGVDVNEGVYESAYGTCTLFFWTNKRNFAYGTCT